ncbi:MAG TPA: phosphoadenylyl-sulfate reductase [Blastocatellia bacterium]|nr:phosphoadenylyl-sulfate reductase [Blastocatellia bacterium]
MSVTSQAFTGTMSLARIEAAAEGLEAASPQKIISWAFSEFGNRIAIATGFGAEGMVLIDMAVKINPRPYIFFIDTGFLFPESYELRRRIEQRYGLEIRSFEPDLTPLDQEEMFGPELWSRDPDLCCRLRKLEPLEEALDGLAAWMTAIRRDQTVFRKNAREVEWDYRWKLVKVNPLARWTRQDVWDYIKENRVPYNPLHDRGYPSLGCTHCTRAIREGEDERAGRWAGRAKTECGLHIQTGTRIQGSGFSPVAGD